METPGTYDPDYTRRFYDAYGTHEWSRLEATAYGRLKAVIHNDFLRRHVRAGQRLLDAGSGPGRFSISAARLGAKVTLLDLSQGQLDLAREKLAEANLLGSVERFTQADVGDLSMFHENSFDVTLCYGGALTYVCEFRHKAVAELVRVTRLGGVLLVSVMSRFGATANVVRRPHLEVLQDPAGWSLWKVIKEGDLAGVPSSKVDMFQPPMHLYSSDELCSLFSGCEVLEIAGSNVCTFEGSASFEKLAEDPQLWAEAVEVERALNHVPGLVDSGSHIILAARKME